MTPRFQFGAPAPRDGEIVKRASMLKISLYREADGDLSGCFEIEGSFGRFSSQGDQEGVDEGLRFVRDLMREFTETRPGEGLLS